MTTNVYHHVYPFAVTTLVTLDGIQIGFHSHHIADDERVLAGDLRQGARMEGPSIITAFVLNANVSLVCNSVHRANLDVRLESHVAQQVY